MRRAVDRRTQEHWRCDLVRVGVAWQLRLEGEVDVAALAELRRTARPVLGGPRECRVRIDLCPVSFMECTTAGWLARFAAAVHRRGGEVVVLVRPGGPVDDLLHRLGLDRALTVVAG